MRTKTPTRNVSLNRETEAEIVALAAEDDRSVSYVIRRAVLAYVASRRASSATPGAGAGDGTAQRRAR
jgi:predicted transcriptional regulator